MIKHITNNELNNVIQTLNSNQKNAIIAILKHSEFIARFINNNPSILKQVAPLFGKPRETYEIYSELNSLINKETKENDFLKIIRRFKMSEYIIIAANDLHYSLSVKDITAHISSFASASLQIAYEYAYNQLCSVHGKPINENGHEIGLAIIGLGKLGGWELNFSSDIDIIYAYDTEKGKTIGIHGKNRLSNSSFFTKMGEKIKFYISERTEDGIVFRVDLRLRPDGDTGDLALPLRSYEIYYESYGQSWERMMLLKARVVAGDQNVGDKFIQMVSPFVFRRSIDYKLIEDLKDVKAKINKRVQLKIGSKKNVKLGFGGIREIEFIIQTLQILNYPKEKKIFNKHSQKSLDLLVKYDVIDGDNALFLKDAYCFLRKLEHMAQIENELQTHVVPEDSETYHLYLERTGFENDEQFQKKYYSITKRVNKIFTELFADVNDSRETSLFDEELEIEDIADILESKGITNSLKCANILRKIVFGRKSTPRSASEIKILKVLLKVIVDELSDVNTPATTLHYFERFFSRSTSIYLFFDIFNEMPVIVKKIVNIFSMSQFLSELIITNNNVLDYLYDPKPPKYEEKDIFNIFTELIHGNNDEEFVANSMRKKHKELIFNAGYAYLNREINIISFVQSLTSLAVGIVQSVFDYAYSLLVSRYGEPLTDQGNISEYIIVGMGKLGSGEMSFGSDLDLIVLFEDNGMTNGSRQIYNSEFFAKLVQKAIFFLSTATAYGYLYKIDMRLRPSGSSGTLVTTIDQFESYQQKTAMLWEKQALLRARVVNKSQDLKQKFRVIQDNVLYDKCICKDGIIEIKDMRMRIENEKGLPYEKNNIKAGYGGLIDIEFSIQMLQLFFGCEFHMLRNPNTHCAMHQMKSEGLISSRDFYALHNSYLFFRHLENVIRAYYNTDASNLPTDEHILENLGKFFGYKNNSAEKLVEEYDRVRKTVRAVFNRIFDKYLNESM